MLSPTRQNHYDKKNLDVPAKTGQLANLAAHVLVAIVLPSSQYVTYHVFPLVTMTKKRRKFIRHFKISSILLCQTKKT